jgi:putative SOS response-associated peptidase YedK
VRSFAIITTTPNELCAELHNRMPVVLKPEAWSVWIGEDPAIASALKALLVPFPSEELTCWPVSARLTKISQRSSGSGDNRTNPAGPTMRRPHSGGQGRRIFTSATKYRPS